MVKEMYYSRFHQITDIRSVLLTSPCYSEVASTQWWKNSLQFFPQVAKTWHHITVHTKPAYFINTIIMEEHFERYCILLSHVYAATDTWKEEQQILHIHNHQIPFLHISSLVAAAHVPPLSKSLFTGCILQGKQLQWLHSLVLQQMEVWINAVLAESRYSYTHLAWSGRATKIPDVELFLVNLMIFPTAQIT